MHFAIFVDGIDLPVVVEKHAEVVDVTLHVVMLPRSVDILRGVTLKTLAVDVCEDIELAVGITDGRCPDALAVDFLVVLQGESIIIKIKTFETVADVFPINKVSGMKNHKSRHSMHRGTCQVVVIAHTEDVRVGELVVEQRVGVRAIAVVSRPRLG
jgi:hypothetical protein